MRFLWIPSGSFVMGSPSDEAGRSPFFPETRNTVRQTRPWVLQETPVTRGQWRTITGGLTPLDRSPIPRDAMQGCGEDCPVNGISWWSAVWFANAVSVAEGTGRALIANNLISGARDGAVVGYRWMERATGDLNAVGAERHPRIALAGNIAH
jgi:formylglycine-generating enzyme required for sulfatase activity